LKRRRITYDDQQPDDADVEDDEGQLLLMEHGEEDEDEDEDYEDPDSVRITAEFDGLDGLDDMELEDQDADFDEEVDEVDEDDLDEDEDDDIDVEEELDESELEDELRDLQKENEQLRDEYMDDEDALPLGEPPRPEKSDAASTEPAELDLSTLDKITALRAAFPTAPVSLCEKTLLKCNKDARKAYNKLLGTRMPVLSLHGMLEHEKRLQSGTTARPYAKNTPDAALEEEYDEHSGSDVESVASLVKHYDHHGFPEGSILDGSASKHMAEALRKSGQAVKMPVLTRFDEDEPPKPAAPADDLPLDDHASDANDEVSSESASEKGSASEDEENYDIGGGDSDTDDGSDSGPEEASSKQKPEPQGGVPLSRKRRRESSSDSNSSDQSDTESDSSDADDNSDNNSGNDSDSDSSSSDDDADTNSGNSKNGDGDSSDDEGAGGAGAGDLSSRGDSSGGSTSDSSSDDSDSSSDSDAEQNTKQKSSCTVHASSRPATKAAPPPRTSPARQQPASREPAAPAPPRQGLTATQRRNARRRAKNKILKEGADGGSISENISASTPHATQDSESIAAMKAALLERLGLVETVSSLPKPAGAMVDTPRSAYSAKIDAAREEIPEAWREKISYSAVECCDEGIELSEPPFPFVQRWDPQQRLGKSRGKRKQHNNQDFYQDYQPSPKKRRYADQYDSFSYLSAANEANNADVTLNYDDEKPEPEHMETDYAEGAAEADEEDDLPPLPEDVSTLPLVQPADVKPGMVLTWKQFLLSKATSWQPQILSLRGEVVDIFGSDSCRVRLAKKDRKLDRNEPTYDEDGTRIYDKFELPVMDEEMEEDEELGYRTFDFADIMETRVLRDKEEEGEAKEQQSLHIQSVPRPLEREVTRSATDLSTTLDHEASQKESDAPHAGETVIPETILEVTEEPEAADSAVDISISEERRHEISELITEAGFRKEVDPSIEQQKDLSSPSRQLDQEMSQERTLEDTTAATVVPPTFGSDVQLPSTPNSHTHQHDDAEAPSLGTTNGTSFRSDFAESQPIILEPFNGFSDEVDGGDSVLGSRVGCPRLDVLHSDGARVVGGRQPDPGFSFQSNNGDHLEAESREIIPETSVVQNRSGQRELSPFPNDTVPNSPAASAGISSVDSFPSLSEVFCTASTSKSGRAPSKAAVMSAIKARKSAVSPDLGYEEAMRKLDRDDDDDHIMSDDNEGLTFDEGAEDEAGEDGEEDEEMDDEDGEEDGEDEDRAEYDDDEFSDIEQYSSHGRAPSSPVDVDWLVNKPIEKPEIRKIKKEISDSQGVNSVEPAKLAKNKNIRVTIQPSPRPRIPRASQPSSFIPSGSQIIEILDSGSEVEDIVENYADDSIDEDWNDSEGSQMPNGSGWVGKNYKTHSSTAGGRGSRRGVSVPTASAPRTSPRRKKSATQPLQASQSRALGSSRPKKSAARVL
jgi:hypothetical protein